MADLIDLQQGGWYNVATGLQMVTNFCTANSESFEYKTFAYEILKNYKKAIKKCFHMQQDQSAEYMKEQGLDFEAICIEFMRCRNMAAIQKRRGQHSSTNKFWRLGIKEGSQCRAESRYQYRHQPTRCV
jgi:hypothetical protein